jgi:hypothetical protein
LIFIILATKKFICKIHKTKKKRLYNLTNAMLTNEEIQYYISITRKLNKWGIIVSNPLTAGIYLTKSFAKQPVRVYYPIILISDTINLLISTTSYWQFYLFDKNDIYCRITTFLGNTLPIFSSWVLTLLSVDRALSTFYPKRFIYLRTIYFQLAALLVSFVLPSILVLQIVIQAIEIDFSMPEWKWDYKPPEYYDTQIYFIVFCSLYGVIPFLVMSLSTIFMINKLRSIKKNASKLDLRRGNRFIRTINGLNFYFLIALLPYIITNLTLLVFQSLYGEISFEQYFFFYFFNSISYLCLWIFYSTSFVVHIICNKVFRRVLMNCLRVNKSKIISN